MKNRDAYIVYLSLEGLFSLFFYIIVTVKRAELNNTK